MGSKNNPHNRSKTQKQMYQGKEVVPAQYITAKGTYMGAKYSKGSEPILGTDGFPLKWEQIQTSS